MSSTRVYGGVQGPDRQAERRDRLLEAGLDLLTEEPGGTVSVRGVCRQANVVARYFYENFTDLDAFVAQVYDGVLARVAKTTQEAVAAAPMREKTRTGIANIVRIIEQDPRIGRLIFSGNLMNTVLTQRRNAANELLATLSGQHLHATYHLDNSESTKAAAYFAVGGVGQTISAWVSGQLHLSSGELVDTLTRLLQPASR